MCETSHNALHILCILLILISVAVSYIYYRHIHHAPIVLKEDTTRIIDKEVQRIPNFIGVTVASVNIQTNTRKVIYQHITDPDVAEMFHTYFVYRNIIDDEPLFVHDNDKINQRLVRIINHEFVCTPWNELLRSRYIPEAGDRIVAACSVATPPSYGGFNGMITVFLSKDPTPDQKELLSLVIRGLSNTISPELASGS